MRIKKTTLKISFLSQAKVAPANSVYCTLIVSSKVSSQHTQLSQDQNANPTQPREGFGLCLSGRTTQIWIIKSFLAKSAECSLNHQKNDPSICIRA